MKSTIVACAFLVTAFTAAWAQHGQSPYVGQESRAIKSLSHAEIVQRLGDARIRPDIGLETASPA